MTTSDRARFFAMLSKLGWSYDTEVREELQALYGVRSLRLLTRPQWLEYNAHLQALVDGHQDTTVMPAPAQPERPPQVGYVTGYAQCLQFASEAVAQGTVWPGEANDQDAQRLAYVLNRALEYRRRDGRISLRQVNTMIGVCGRYPLADFRRACQIWAGTKKSTGENFFYGICRNTGRDRQAEAYHPHPGLSIV